MTTIPPLTSSSTPSRQRSNKIIGDLLVSRAARDQRSSHCATADPEHGRTYRLGVAGRDMASRVKARISTITYCPGARSWLNAAAGSLCEIEPGADVALRLAGRHAGMVFVADDLAAWLVFILAETGRKRLTSLVLGDDQKRALRSAATAAARRTATELSPDDAEQAEQVAMVISQVFSEPVQDAPLARQATLLEALQAGIAEQLAVLDDASLTGTGQSSADVLGVPGTEVAAKLTGHLLEEVMARGSHGGPLEPLANQLNHDVTHLQGQRIEDVLRRLDNDVRKALTQSDTTDTVTAPKQVTEWNALDLGVHPAIDTRADDSAGLPSYVCRSHDRELRGLLSGVGDPAMVVLVGGSCTGKSRACYEAARECLGGWPMFRPADAPELERLLSRQRIGERAVVWLDEAHVYLDGRLQRGSEAVQYIQRALTGGPGPLIVIGSMPSERWADLTAPPNGGKDDPHLQARTLLGMHAVRKIEVPDDFSTAEPGDLRELDRAADHDPRLAAAQRAGGDGLQITQVLAGGVLMLDRYLHPPDIYSRAVVTAAMDARRLGHWDAIPPALLEEAVPGYLTASQRTAPAPWFDAALATAAEAVRGVRALTPTRLQPGIGGPDGYILHDYLDEHARTTREAVAPPASLWDALLARTASPADLTRIADEAKDRSLYRYAVLTAARAAEAADTGATFFVARLLSEARRVEECIAWLWPFAEAGDSEAMLLLATELLKSEQENRYEENLHWMRRAAEAGSTKAIRELADVLSYRATALPEEAIRWLRELASADDLDAMQRLADLLDEFGRPGEAAAWRQRREELIEANRPRSAAELQELLERVGLGDAPLSYGDESITALRTRAEAGDPGAMEGLAGRLDQAGQSGEAIDWLCRAADAGSSIAALNLAKILHRMGRTDEALNAIHRAATGWDDAFLAFEEVMPWLRKVGGQSSLESFLTAAARAGNGWATAYLARELARNGQTAEAILWLRPSAEKGNLGAMELLGLFLDQVGQVAEARAWYRRVDQTASPFLLFALASILEKGGWPDRALLRYRNAIECKRTDAMNPLAELLVRVGRTEEAKHLRAFGIEPGGSTAQAWRVPTSESIAAAAGTE
jgi:TPR repeat protein